MKLNRNYWVMAKSCAWLLNAIAVTSLLISCSGDKTAGTDEQSEGIVAIKNLDIAGVSQKGPFVKGSAVTVQGIDCKTMKLTGESFEGTVKNDKGEFTVDNVTLSSSCAVFEVTGNYFNEVTDKKTKDKLTLRALTNLKDRKNVNINVLTELEYERLMNLAASKETSFAEAKTQAEKEVLAAFGFNDNTTDKVQEFENLNIFEKGEGNAALLAVSVLMQGDADAASLAKRLEKFADDFAEDGEWNDSKTKTEIAEWATTAKENGKLDTIRKNVETMNDGDKVAAFETYVAAVIPDSVLASSPSSSSVTLSGTSVKSNGSSSSKDGGSEAAMTSSSRHSGLDPESSGSTEESYLNPKIKYDSIVDSRDGQVYKTVKIGNQVWMAQNLNYADSVKTPSLKGRSWCFENDSTNCLTYGRLYTWAAAVDSQGICPEGWHLPNKSEWELLVEAVGSQSGSKLKSLAGWSYDGNGVDEFGFSALPAGYRLYAESLECGPIKTSRCASNEFVGVGIDANLWTATEYNTKEAYYFHLGDDREDALLKPHEQTYGISVRCVKGKLVALASSSSVASSSSSSALWTEAQSSSSFVFDLSVPKESYLNPDVQYGSLVDSRDNQIYKTVQIGDQVWMAQNLNYASEGSSCFNDTAAYCELFGRLYYWSAAMDSVGTWSDNGKGCGFKKSCTPTYPVRGVCPEGWHLPSAEEFETLVATIGGLDSASIKLMSPLGWYDHFMTRQFNPNNSTGFSAIAAGGKSTESGYWGIGRGAGFFSSTDYNTYNARNMSLYPGEPAVGTSSKNGMESVRCVKDE